MKKNKIKCDVKSCEHYDCADKSCELDDIKVSCTCAKDDCATKDETVCTNFKKKKDDEECPDKVTDTEYEVKQEDEY